MGRKVLAVIVAMIVAMGVIMLVQMLSSLQFAPPTDEVMKDPVRLREYMVSMPVTAYVIVLVGYILGSFAGGFIVTKMSRRESPGISLPILIGVLLTIGGILNFTFLPGQPLWFMVLCFLTYIPFALLGHRFAR